MEVEHGDNQFIAETWLSQWPSVGPLAPAELYSSELQGNGNGHRMSPNFHTFDPRAERFWRMGFHATPSKSPLDVSPPLCHTHLDIYQVGRNSSIPKGRNSNPKKDCHKCTHMCTYITPYTPNTFTHIFVHTTYHAGTSSPTCPNLGSHTRLSQHLLTLSTHTPYSQARQDTNPLTPSSQ